MKKHMLSLVAACAAAVVGFAEGTSAEILAKIGSSTNPDKVEAIDLGNNMYALRFAGAQTSTFTFSSKCTVKEALVVGGGGAGGGDCGAGGGGGGLIHLTDLSSEYGVNDALSLTVGAGGAVSGEKKKGTPGGHSQLSMDGTTYTAFGGGGGGQWTSGGNDKPVPGSDGTGCGAGAIGSGGVGTTTMDTSIPGYYANSGGGSSGITNAGGGGGGAGSEGAAVITDGKIGGNGGDGLQLSITGEPVYYAAGGGGGSGVSTSTRGLGGQGGGGDGGLAASGKVGLSATGYGCGGGGGGGGNKGSSKGGAGSDGVVILVVLRSSEKAEFNVIVSSNAAGYDNWTAELMFVGLDENSSPAQAYLTLSKNSDGSNPVIDNQPFGAPQSEEYTAFSATIPDLEPSTTYYAFIRATNKAGEEANADRIEFKTLTPTAPTGSFRLLDLGSDSQTFEATLDDFGDGSTNAVLTMELSTTAGFDEIAASASVTVDATGAQTLTVSGLESGVLYYSRLKIDNSWHVPYVTALQSYATRAQVECAGIGYTTTETGFDVSVSISYVSVDDATVTLFADGVQVGEAQTITAVGNYSFAVTADANSVLLNAVVEYGATEKEFTITATKGTTSRIVGNVADHASAATALKVNPGDQITLPPLVGLGSYRILNNSFLSRDGMVLTAVKPGIVGVECYDASGALATTMAVIVLPEQIGSGNIYIRAETTDQDWHSQDNWLTADGAVATDYPHNADDIAIIPRLSNGQYFKVKEDISLGGLYVGVIKSGVSSTYYIQRADGVKTIPVVTFARTDGETLAIQVCGNNQDAANARRTTLQFGDSNNKLGFRYEVDTVFDGGWDGVNANCACGRPAYAANCTNTIPAGVTFMLRNIDTTGTDAGCTFAAPALAGEGVFWNRSGANIRFESSRMSDLFTGVIRDSSHGNKQIWRSGPSYFYSAAVTNASAEAYGFVANSSGTPGANTSGAGMICTGHDHSHANPGAHPWINWLPARGMTLVNSTYFCGSTELSSYGVGVAEYKYTATTTIGQGFSFIYRNSNRDNKSGHPINWFETDAIAHAGKGTIRVDDFHRSNYVDVSDTTNNVTIIHGIKNFAVGGAGDPKASENYPIVPWMVTPSKNTDSGKLAFTCADDDDRICDMGTRTNRKLDEVVAADENAYVKDQSAALTADRTVNSLWLYNANKEKKLGVEKTLTIASGGLILRADNSAIGTIDGGDANGALVLGDATHPGYVFADATTASKPGAIYSSVTAPGGLVFGYTGYALLAGDQTGVDDELVVNAGTLDLGSQDKSVACTLDVPVRILANATVKMNNAEMAGSAVYFDDIAGYSGKIQLNADTTCKKLYVRDTPEETEWASMRRGTYGATGSGAQFVDDDRFAGSGVLIVRKDDITCGLRIILR